ncbi:MAG: nitroreductase family protein [Oscillospiraceae bacterium]|jgi:nitroreductase|nr:nitroreductase family protein [Oscillospiraceae bacterium]
MLNETIRTIMKRYSCRAFTEKMPSDEDLQTITRAALAAPSGVNRQPWRIIVVKNKDIIKEMDDEGMKILAAMPDKSTYERIMSRSGSLFYGAPCIMIISITKAVPAGAEMFDCAIVAENIALAATSMGIDNLICGLAVLPFAGEKGAEFGRRLGFHEGYDMGLGVLLGYAKETGGKPHDLDPAKISFVE